MNPQDDGLRIRLSPLRLESIHPAFHGEVRGIDRDPRLLVGRFKWLVPLRDDGTPILEKGMARFSLRDVKPGDLYSFLVRLRQNGEHLYVVLYWRVSSPEQSKRVTLQAQLRWLLKKCADAGLRVAGIAVDVESGTKEVREALEGVDEAIIAGHVQVVVVPTISRLERDLKHFVDRTFRWTERDSLVYYGATYAGPGFNWVHWHADTQRIAAIQRAHKAEMDVVELKAAISSSMETLMEDGYLVAGRRHQLMWYDIEIEDPEKPFSRRRLSPVVDSDEVRRVALMLQKGVDAKDRQTLVQIAEDQSERTGKAIYAENVEWEIRMGFFAGLNRRSPDNDFVVEAPSLVILDDRDLLSRMIENLNTLKGLFSRRRKQTMPEDLPEAVLLQLAELEESSGRKIRARVTCDDGHPLSECSLLQVAKDVPAGFVQYIFYCPRCGAGRFNKGKARWPRIKDLRTVGEWPEENCWRCGKWGNLREELAVRVGSVTRRLMICDGHGDSEPRLWTGPAISNPNVHSNLSGGKRELAQSSRSGSEEPAHMEPGTEYIPPSPAELGLVKRYRYGGRAPRPLWQVPLPRPAPEDAVNLHTAASWVAAFLEQQGLSFSITRRQRDEMVKSLVQHNPDALSFLSPQLTREVRWILKDRNLDLCTSYAKSPGGGYFWVEPLDEGIPGSKPVPGHSWAHVRPSKYVTLEGRPLPDGVPYPLYEEAMPVNHSFFADCTGPALRSRILGFLLETRNVSFLLKHLRIVALGRDLPRSSHRYGPGVYQAVEAAAQELLAKGLILRHAKYPGRQARVYWIEDGPPSSPGEGASKQST